MTNEKMKLLEFVWNAAVNPLNSAEVRNWLRNQYNKLLNEHS